MFARWFITICQNNKGDELSKNLWSGVEYEQFDVNGQKHTNTLLYFKVSIVNYFSTTVS